MLLENNPVPQDARVRREANALVAAGYHVTVICPAGKGQPSRETVGGVLVYRYPEPRGGDGVFGYLWEYGYSLTMTLLLSVRVWLAAGFNVIHAHNPPDLFVLVAILYRPLGVKFVFDHHDLSPEMYYARFHGKGNRIVHAALIWFEKLSFTVADHVIATNESYKNIAMERGGVDEKRITVVRNGPEGNRLRPVEPDPEIRQRATCILGYVGVIGVQDGVDYFIRALDRLINELGYSNVLAIIIGKGDAVEDLQRLSRALKLDSHIWFTGRVSDEDLIRYLSTADVCVDPDPSNSFNDQSTMIKMTEYMALGRPIVAFDLP